MFEIFLSKRLFISKGGYKEGAQGGTQRVKSDLKMLRIKSGTVLK